MSDEVLRQLERAALAGDTEARARLVREVARTKGAEILAFGKALKKLLVQANAKRRLFRVTELDVADAITRRMRHRAHGDLRWTWADSQEYGDKPRLGWKAKGVSYSIGRSGLVHQHKVAFDGSPTTDERTIVLYVVRGPDAVVVAGTAPREGPCVLKLGALELGTSSKPDDFASWFPGEKCDPSVRESSFVVDAWAEHALQS